MIEEEDKIVGNIGKEVKEWMETVGWLFLLEILCSKLEKLESDLTWLDISKHSTI
jgi:hypothetical protein